MPVADIIELIGVARAQAGTPIVGVEMFRCAVLVVIDTFAAWAQLPENAEKDPGAVQAALEPLVDAGDFAKARPAPQTPVPGVAAAERLGTARAARNGTHAASRRRSRSSS